MRRSLAVAAVVFVGVVGLGQVLDVGIFEDLTTTNVWARIGPDATVWNSYVLGGQHGALYGSAAPYWTFVPSLAADFPSQFFAAAEAATECRKWCLNIPWVGKNCDEYCNEVCRIAAEYPDSHIALVPLRKGITWSDGTPFTADDVVFTYNVLLTEIEGGRFGILLGGNWPSYVPDALVAVEKVDNLTVAFVYSVEPGLGEWTFGALFCPIVQKAYWEPHFQAALGTDDPTRNLLRVTPTDEPILGGYQFVQWQPGAFAQVNKNPKYYGTGETLTFYDGGGFTIENPKLGFSLEGYGGVTGKVDLSLTEGPYVDSILYSIFLNQDAAVLALQGGQIATFLNPLGLARGFQQRLATTPNVQIVSNPPWGFRYMAFNMRRTPMNNAAFRQAVATLIDREFLAEGVFQGIIVSMYSAVPDSNPFWHNPDVTIYGQGMTRAQRIEEAVRILKGAGFSWDAEPKVVSPGTRDEAVIGVLPDGTEVSAPRGFKLPDGTYCPELELLTPSAGYDPLRATFGLYIEQWAREIGLPIKANLTGFNVIVDKVWAIDGFNYDMYILGWSLGNPAFPDYLYYFWHSDMDFIDGWNTPGYHNDEFDQLASDFLAAQSVDEARPLVFRMQEILAEDVPYIILFDSPIVEAFRADMIEFPYTEVLGGIQFVWPLTTVKALK